jgi:hypothetical protein
MITAELLKTKKELALNLYVKTGNSEAARLKYVFTAALANFERFPGIDPEEVRSIIKSLKELEYLALELNTQLIAGK